MNFKNWITFNENVEDNWDLWCDTLEKYAENNPSEKRVLNSLKDRLYLSTENGSLKNVLGKTTPLFNMIKRVLKDKNIENYNWFCFSLGCFVAYEGMHEEDLRSSIEEVKRRIASRELLKSEIGRKGWLVIGSESKEYVDETIRRNQTVSKRQQEKLRKLGLTLSEDPRLIKVLAEEDDFILYLCPKLPKTADRNLISDRHAILCKYGRGGKFCTADPTGTYHFNYANNDIYIFHVNNKVKYQFVSCDDSNNKQFMTVENRPPAEIEKDEKDFLIRYKAPIDCYNLKTSSVSYQDLLKAVKDPEKDWSIETFKQASVDAVERYLNTALQTGKEKDILLLIKSGLFVSRNNLSTTSRTQLNLESFIEKLKDYSFAQEVIKELINLLSTDRIFQYYVNNATIEAILEASDLDNIKLSFSKLERAANNISSNQECFNILKKHKNDEELIQILAKTNKPPAAMLIAIYKDKQKICNILRTNDKLDITVDETIDLLLGALRPFYGSSWNLSKALIPEIKTGVSSKEMASALGSKVITNSIRLPGEVVLGLHSKMSGKILRSKLFSDINLSKEQAKELIEIIASKHENLDQEDIRNIIQAYKDLGIHKAVQKISTFLGKRNLKKLDRYDRSSLGV